MSEFEDLMRQKAVALKYNPDKNGAPVIVASGMGYLAEKITETAMEAGVPVYEDDSLASFSWDRRFLWNCTRPLWISISIFWDMCRGQRPIKKQQGRPRRAGTTWRPEPAWNKAARLHRELRRS